MHHLRPVPLSSMIWCWWITAVRVEIFAAAVFVQIFFNKFFYFIYGRIWLFILSYNQILDAFSLNFFLFARKQATGLHTSPLMKNKNKKKKIVFVFQWERLRFRRMYVIGGPKYFHVSARYLLYDLCSCMTVVTLFF